MVALPHAQATRFISSAISSSFELSVSTVTATATETATATTTSVVTTTLTSTASFVPPTGYAALIAISEGKAAGLKGFPEGFIPPIFEPGYVPEDRGGTLLIICYVSITVAAIAVLARLITRRVVTGRLALDDWSVIPALAFACALTSSNILAVTTGGVGRHAWDLTPETIEEGIKKPIPHLILYAATLLCVKLSILFFIQRLAGPTCTTRFQIVIYAFFAANIAFAIGCILAYTFQCSPVQAGFDLTLKFYPSTTCRDQEVEYWITAGLNTASDLGMLALPIYVVIGLRLSLQKKVAAIIMFTIGGLACVCAMIRMAYIGTWANSYDPSWDAYYPTIWGQLEATLSLTAISLPALKTLFARVIPGLITSGQRSGHSGSDPRSLTDSSGMRTKARDSLGDLFRQTSFVRRKIGRKMSNATSRGKPSLDIHTRRASAPVLRTPDTTFVTSKTHHDATQLYSINPDSGEDLARFELELINTNGGPTRAELELEQRTKDYRQGSDRHPSGGWNG